MIDSVIAGTGDSRYLRTSLAADTTWEDALTMLRAGTFPIDLAGINAAGFTTVGTALTSATLLKAAVCTALGLDANATPSDAWEAVIALIGGKADADAVITAIGYDSSTKTLTATINGVVTDVTTFDFVNAEEAAEAAPVQPEDLYKAFPTDTESGPVASFPDGADSIPVKDLSVAITPSQSGSGDPSPSNVRPISGWTGATILRAGVNLFNKTTATLGKSINGSGGITNRSGTDAFYSDFIPIYAEVGMRFRHTAPGVSAKTMRIVLYDKNKGYMRGEATPSAGGNTCAITISQSDVDAGAAYLRISAYSAGVYDYAMCTVGNDVAQEYSPYVGTVYAVTFPSEAGTVYGGTLNVTTGVLTVDRAFTTFDGSEDESWTVASDSARKYIAVADIDTGTPDTEKLNGLQSNMFKAWSYSGGPASATANTPVITGRYNIAQINVFYNEYNTVENWKAYLSSNNLQVVYPLAVPITYQLTSQEVRTVLGSNNIWADIGDTAVVYRADPTLYIEKLTGSTEDDMIADSAIASGKYFMVGNRLFLSTAAIAAGAMLTVGTNCVETNLAAALNALNS